jgi:hypothetical protein
MILIGVCSREWLQQALFFRAKRLVKRSAAP